MPFSTTAVAPGVLYQPGSVAWSSSESRNWNWLSIGSSDSDFDSFTTVRNGGSRKEPLRFYITFLSLPAPLPQYVLVVWSLKVFIFSWLVDQSCFLGSC